MQQIGQRPDAQIHLWIGMRDPACFKIIHLNRQVFRLNWIALVVMLMQVMSRPA
jgi:hypothetical protein